MREVFLQVLDRKLLRPVEPTVDIEVPELFRRHERRLVSDDCIAQAIDVSRRPDECSESGLLRDLPDETRLRRAHGLTAAGRWHRPNGGRRLPRSRRRKLLARLDHGAASCTSGYYWSLPKLPPWREFRICNCRTPLLRRDIRVSTRRSTSERCRKRTLLFFRNLRIIKELGDPLRIDVSSHGS
jgi:hypothetical protein